MGLVGQKFVTGNKSAVCVKVRDTYTGRGAKGNAPITKSAFLKF